MSFTPPNQDENPIISLLKHHGAMRKSDIMVGIDRWWYGYQAGPLFQDAVQSGVIVQDPNTKLWKLSGHEQNANYLPGDASNVSNCSDCGVRDEPILPREIDTSRPKMLLKDGYSKTVPAEPQQKFGLRGYENHAHVVYSGSPSEEEDQLCQACGKPADDPIHRVDNEQTKPHKFLKEGSEDECQICGAPEKDAIHNIGNESDGFMPKEDPRTISILIKNSKNSGIPDQDIADTLSTNGVRPETMASALRILSGHTPLHEVKFLSLPRPSWLQESSPDSTGTYSGQVHTYKKSDLGYMELKGGFTCGKCAWFRSPNRCGLVVDPEDPDIDPNDGCCAAFITDKKAKEMLLPRIVFEQGPLPLEPHVTSPDVVDWFDKLSTADKKTILPNTNKQDPRFKDLSTEEKYLANDYYDGKLKGYEDFREEDHPRDSDGKFATKGAGSSGGGGDDGAKYAGVMGYEPEKMTDDQLKKEIEYWKNTANGQRPGSLQRLQSDAKSQAAKQELEKRLAGGNKTEEPKTPVTPQKHISGIDVYKNLPKESGPEAMRKRQEIFRPFEKDNMEVAKLRDEANDIKYRLNLWQSIKDEKTDPKEIADIEGKLSQWKQDRENLLQKKTEIENQLGEHLEPVEVQNLLKRRQGYLDDQKRRKPGSKAWSDNDTFSKIMDRQVDKFRSGVDFGHNEEEWQKEREAVKKERDKQYEKQRAEQKVKDEKKLAKSNDTIDKSKKILKDHGIDVEKFDLTGPNIDREIDKYHLEGLKLDPRKDQETHEKWIKANQTFNQLKAAQLNIVLQQQAQAFGLRNVSSRIKDLHKKFKYRAENELSSHPYRGMHVYSDANDKHTKHNLEAIAHAPGVAKTQVKHYEIHKGPGDKFQGSTGKVQAAGVWIKNGEDARTLKTWYNDEASRKKFVDPSEFETVGDHELAHAGYDGVADFVSFPPKQDASEEKKKKWEDVKHAFDHFNDVAEQTGYSPGFHLHEYTDSYYRKHDDRRWTETHSKLREFEINGNLKVIESDAQHVVDNPKDETFRDVNGIPSVEAAQNTLKLIKAYKGLRAEEDKL